MSYPRRYTRITYEGVSFLSVLAFIVLGSIMRQINLLVLLSGLMIAPFFFNWRISMKMVERLSAGRRTPPRVHAGTPFNLVWQIRNDRRRIPAWGIRIVDCLKYQGMPPRQAERMTLIAGAIEPGETVRVTCRCLLPRRGICEFGPAEASSAFPVGLIRSRVRVPGLHAVTVAPRLGKMTASWSRLTRLQREGTHSRQRQQSSGDEQFYAIRPWQSGDNRRLVHWRSSAKHDELMVRQFDQRTDRTLALALDLHAGSATAAEIEHAVSFMATALHAAMTERMPAAIAIFGDQQQVLGSQVRNATGAAMQILATVQPAADTGIVAGLAQLERAAGRRAALVVVSTRSRAEALANHPPDPTSPAAAGHWIDLRAGGGRDYFMPAGDSCREFILDTVEDRQRGQS